MAPDPYGLARRPEPASPDEDDYESFRATFAGSERGRWFLAEFARRNRHPDTAVLLAALERIETLVTARSPASESERMRADLRVLLDTLRLARPDIDGTTNAGMKMSKLGALLSLLERRIESIAEPSRELPPPDTEMLGTTAMPESAAAENGRPALSVVPIPDEPQLPLPSPANDQPPTMVLVNKTVAPRAGIMPSVSVFEIDPEIFAAPPPVQIEPPAAPAADVRVQPSRSFAPPKTTPTERAVIEQQLFDWTVPLDLPDVGFTSAEPQRAQVAEAAPEPPVPAEAPFMLDAGIVASIQSSLAKLFATSGEAQPSEPAAHAEPAPVAKTAALPERASGMTPSAPAVSQAPVYERSAAADPLAPVRAMTDEERLALFT